MPRVYEQKVSFSSGQVCANLIGKSGSKVYNNGLKTLHNAIIESSGTIKARYGSSAVSYYNEQIERIICLNMEDSAITILFAKEKIKIIEQNNNQQTQTTWQKTLFNTQFIKHIKYVQIYNQIILVCPYCMPLIITRGGVGAYNFDNFIYKKNSKGITTQPSISYYNATLTASGNSGTVNLVADKNIFNSGYEGSILILNNTTEAEVLKCINATTLQVKLNSNISGSLVFSKEQWQEPVFSGARGWASFVAVFQNRLILGGSAQNNNIVYFSKTGDYFNFDVGTAQDDEAIDLRINNNKGLNISNIFCNNNLNLYSNQGLWQVTSEVLTPTNAFATLYDGISIYNKYAMPIHQFNNGVLFMGYDECLYLQQVSINGTTESINLSQNSKDLISSPKAIVVDDSSNNVFVLNEDGTIAVMFYYKEQQAIGWSLWKTDGEYKSIDKNDKGIFCIVKRGSYYFLEQYNKDCLLDCSVSVSDLSQDTQNSLYNVFVPINKLDILNKQQQYLGQFNVFSSNYKEDGSNKVLTGFFIQSNKKLEQTVDVGLKFDILIDPLPFSSVSVGTQVQGGFLRPTAITFRIFKTNKLIVKLGYNTVAYNNVNLPSDLYSGDIKLRMLGWFKSSTNSHWSIKQPAFYKFNLIAVMSEVMVQY